MHQGHQQAWERCSSPVIWKCGRDSKGLGLRGITLVPVVELLQAQNINTAFLTAWAIKIKNSIGYRMQIQSLDCLSLSLSWRRNNHFNQQPCSWWCITTWSRRNKESFWTIGTTSWRSSLWSHQEQHSSNSYTDTWSANDNNAYPMPSMLIYTPSADSNTSSSASFATLQPFLSHSPALLPLPIRLFLVPSPLSIPVSSFICLPTNIACLLQFI